MFSNTINTFWGGPAVFVRNGIPHSSIPPVVDHPSIESMGVSIHGPTDTINLYMFMYILEL